MNYDDYNRMCENIAPEAAKVWCSIVDFMKQVSEHHSKDVVWKLVEPRRTVAPNGYHPHKIVASMLYTTLVEAHDKAAHQIDPVGMEITATAIAYQVVRHEVPVYYVKEEFARAVAATDLPDDFFLADLHWPRPAMVIGWPVAFMKEMVGADVSYVFAASFQKNVDYKPPFPLQGKVIFMPDDKVAWHHVLWEQGNVGSYLSAYWTRDRVADTVTKYTYTDFTGRHDEARIMVDEERSNKISGLMLKLLLVLNMMPHLIETGTIQRKEKVKKGIVRQALWNPNIIGGKYRVSTSGQGDGTHASPRMHWRRGHVAFVARRKKGADFLSVGVMPRRTDGNIDWDRVTPEQRELFWSCHERKWLEPVLVMAPEDVE